MKVLDKDSKKKSLKKNKVKISSLMKIDEEPSKIVDKIQNTELIFSIENMEGTISTSKDEKVKIDSFDEYLKIKQESNTKRIQNKDYQYAVEKSRFLTTLNKTIYSYICKYLTNNDNYSIITVKNNNFSNDSFTNNNNNSLNINYRLRMDDIFYSKFKIYKENEKIMINNQIFINFLYYLNQNFENKNIIINLNILSEKTIPIIKLYSLFFEKIIILNGFLLIGIKYKKNIELNELLLKVIKNEYKFSVNIESNIEKKIIKYFESIYSIYVKIYKDFIKTRDENSYILSRYYFNFYLIKNMGIQYEKEFLDELSLYYVNLFKLKIYSKNDIKKIESNINSREGTYISSMIQKYGYKKCFEVGLAHGISSIYILKNPGTSLISIDPFQKSQWDNQALKFIKHLGYDKNHSLIEKKSHVALPEMLEKYGEDSFDFCFIDGDHKFDVTLLDFYYSSLMIKIGGMIIIDDALHAGVNKCIKFIDTNMSNFKKLESPNTIAVYKKMGEDKREWFYHKNF